MPMKKQKYPEIHFDIMNIELVKCMKVQEEAK
jgi:hypothetical protein